MKTKTAPFPPDSVVIAREGYVVNLGGVEVLVVAESRHRGDEQIVVQRPELFVPDGTPPTLIERIEPPEPPPLVAEPVRIPKLRAKKDWRSEKLDAPGPGLGAPAQKVFFNLKKGDLWDAGQPELRMLSNRQLRELFEEVDPE
jgi:hypothetical protein